MRTFLSAVVATLLTFYVRDGFTQGCAADCGVSQRDPHGYCPSGTTPPVSSPRARPDRCAAGDHFTRDHCCPDGLWWPARGLGCAPNTSTAACEQQDQDACVALADGYRDGRGVTQDLARAAQMYQRACAAQNPDACESLAGLFRSGRGVSRDDARASQLDVLACRQGSAAACYQRALAMWDGHGVPMDRPAALVAYESACNHGSAEACLALGGSMSPYGADHAVTANPERAVELFQRACELGSVAGCERATTEAGVLPGDHNRLRAFAAQRGCDLGSEGLCVQLALWELGVAGSIPGMRINNGQGILGLERACARNNIAGCYWLARMLNDGRGIGRDQDRAVGLFRRVCDAHGPPDACNLAHPSSTNPDGH